MSRLIGINGFKTAGKDTTYDAVRSCHPGTVLRAGFADKLKIMAMLALGYEGDAAQLIGLANRLKENGGVVGSLLPTNLSENGGRLEVPLNITGREYLQLFGGEARKVFGESFWVDQVLPPPRPQVHPTSLLEAMIDPWTGQARGKHDILCITDVRYPNEAERVLDLGGEIWEVVRPGLESDGHDSEKPLPPEYVTLKLYNDGAIDELYAQVRRLVA